MYAVNQCSNPRNLFYFIFIYFINVALNTETINEINNKLGKAGARNSISQLLRDQSCVVRGKKLSKLVYCPVKLSFI